MMPTELEPGFSVGPWRVLRRLDWGSYGVVFLAQRAGHPESPPVALKMARNPGDPRFEREGQLLQRTPHPSIPGYKDSGVWTSPEGHRYPYLVMELVEGFTLYEWFRQQPRSSRQVLAVLQQVASALATAHAGGAVHRDVKGDNIRITVQGRAVLLDWGSGWFASARPLTDTTAPPGTTRYRPPEQRLFAWRFRRDLEARWHAQPTDDLYALGVTFYRLVTGTYLPPLSEGGEPVVREAPRPSGYATISMDVEALILRLLSEEPATRGSAGALAQEVAALAIATGEDADRLILPTASAQRTEPGGPSSNELQEDESQNDDEEEGLSDTDEPTGSSSSTPARPKRRARRVRALSTWLSWASAAMVGGLLVLAGGEVRSRVFEPQPTTSRAAPEEEEREQIPPDEVSHFAPDAGVSEEALSIVQDLPRVVMPLVISLGVPMPKRPQEGQKRPPCSAGQVAVNGACWAGPIKGQEAPCPPGMFDHEGECYFAIFDAPRTPTSDPP
jgi:serine/threonine protein kinase